MICKSVKIWGDKKCQGINDNGFIPVLKTYILDSSRKRGAVMICPGGGYQGLSDREAEPVALKFNAAGYHAFVLYYSVSPKRHPAPLLDLSRAMSIVRKNENKWKVNTSKIAVCGFSAGGHLAASLGVHWNKPYLQNAKGVGLGMNKPNALILCYPVISSGKFINKGSFDNLLGKGADKELLFEMSLENHINENTPPAFIWHTYNDTAVPVENSLNFSLEMRKKGIPFELHIYPEGPHGLSLATDETNDGSIGKNLHVATWNNLCIEWLNKLFF
jgi:acetyl esterase/lipase